MADGLTITDGITSLDIGVEAIREEEPRRTGGEATAFNGQLRPSYRAEHRRWTARCAPIGKTDYETLKSLIANRVPVSVTGPVVLNDTITALISASFDLTAVSTAVDGVPFIYGIQLTIDEQESGVTPAVYLPVNGYFFPGLTSQKVSLGNYSALDGLSKVSVILWFVPVSIGGGTFGAIFTRYNDSSPGDTQDQFWVGRSANNFAWIVRTATGNAVGTTGAANLLVGDAYKCAFVFDGTQTGNANRLKAWTAHFTSSAWTADAAETIAFSGSSVPAALVTAASSTDAKLGGSVGAFNAMNGILLGVRVWTGVALTGAEVAAETLDTNVITPDLHYALDGSLDNTGSDSGFNGTASGNLVVPCFYDLS